MPRNAELLKTRQAVISRGVGFVTDFFAARAENSEIWDVEGRRFIDFGAGIGVCNTGHRHPEVMAAARAQMEAFTHTCHQVTPYASYVELAKKLNQILPGDSQKKTCFLTTGAEAVENSIKIARAWTSRPAIISCSGGFHGRTFMGMSLTGKVIPYKADFGPMIADIYRFPFPMKLHGISVEDSLNALDRIFHSDVAPERVAAIIFEPIQGEGGFYVAPPDFIEHLRKICNAHGIVMIADEVQAGFGRTGKFFAMEHYGVEADITTLAKGLGGGFPISAVVGRADIMDAPNPGGLGGTYAGNAVAVATANAVVDIMDDENFHKRTRILGARLRNMLEELGRHTDYIADVRGQGLMLAVEFIDPQSGEPRPDIVTAIIQYAKEHGLILLSCGIYANVIRFLPPLTIQDEVFEEALTIISDAIKASI